MELGTGIAVAGIWLGVGLSALKAGEASIAIAFCAMFATCIVALVSM